MKIFDLIQKTGKSKRDGVWEKIKSPSIRKRHRQALPGKRSRAVLRSGKKQDAFDVYFRYLDMFVRDYEKTRRMIELLSEFAVNGSSLLMKHTDNRQARCDILVLSQIKACFVMWFLYLLGIALVIDYVIAKKLEEPLRFVRETPC